MNWNRLTRNEHQNNSKVGVRVVRVTDRDWVRVCTPKQRVEAEIGAETNENAAEGRDDGRRKQHKTHHLEREVISTARVEHEEQRLAPLGQCEHQKREAIWGQIQREVQIMTERLLGTRLHRVIYEQAAGLHMNRLQGYI